MSVVPIAIGRALELRDAACVAWVMDPFCFGLAGELWVFSVCRDELSVFASAVLILLISESIKASASVVVAAGKVYRLGSRRSSVLEMLGVVPIWSFGVGVVVMVKSRRSAAVVRLSSSGSVDFWAPTVTFDVTAVAVLGELLLFLPLVLLLLMLRMLLMLLLLLWLLLPLLVCWEGEYRAARVIEVAASGRCCVCEGSKDVSSLVPFLPRPGEKLLTVENLKLLPFELVREGMGAEV